MSVRACIFDVFGTLVDWRGGIAATVREVLGAREIEISPASFADRWRAEYQPGMARVRDGARGYVPLEVLHLENLRRVVADAGIDLSDAEAEALNDGWSRLPAWPDTRAALAAIRVKMPVAPCSNGSIAMMTGIARHNGMVWDAILGAEIARNYKPQAEVYVASARALGLEPRQVMMVAAHNDDLAAARTAGLATGFFPRATEHGTDQRTDLEATGDWDIVVPDIATLAARL